MQVGEEDVEDLRAATGIPLKFARALVQSKGQPMRNGPLKVKPSLLEAEKFHEATKDGGGGMMVLSGNVGLGKTMAACWWLYRWPDSLFLPSPHLARLSSYDIDEQTRVEQVGRLVIDDVGMEMIGKSEAFKFAFDSLMNTRWSNERPTMVTTNLPLDRFFARYGGRVRDRIQDRDFSVRLPEEPSMRGGRA